MTLFALLMKYIKTLDTSTYSKTTVMEDQLVEFVAKLQVFK